MRIRGFKVRFLPFPSYFFSFLLNSFPNSPPSDKMFSIINPTFAKAEEKSKTHSRQAEGVAHAHITGVHAYVGPTIGGFIRTHARSLRF